MIRLINIIGKLNKVGSVQLLKDLKYLPRWVVLLIDLFFLFISAVISVLILLGLDIRPKEPTEFVKIYSLILIYHSFFMFSFKTYAGVIRHSTFFDIFKILQAGVCTAIIALLTNFVWIYYFHEKLILTSFIVLYFMISFILLFMFRLSVKEMYQTIGEIGRSSLKKNILVLGISGESIAIAKAIMDNPKIPYYIKGFLSHDDENRRAMILGKSIISRKNFINYNDNLNIEGVIMVKESLTREQTNDWVNILLEKEIKIYKAPSVQKLRDSDNVNVIKAIQIEDLLNRKPIKLENVEVRKRHYNKEVLITGGAGSIGSEIVRQVALYNPSLIVIIDQAETPLYDLELELKFQFPDIQFKFILANISNLERIEPIFQKYSFSMVYHAAAYKHVPIIEENPHEAISVNVLGSRNIALLASKYQVNRFVMISTDKAVNPTNVMGASKRVAELFVQSLQDLPNNKTKFITTRFGNVLGSNGSVIPRFKTLIEKGGPITITHPDIVRYFMTIREACELVMHAGAMGNGGEIYVFDMGKPVKILDLAIRMIKLSGLEPHVDIKIIFTGLRPGEKLYEELLSNDTDTLPTTHDKILISKDPTMGFEEIEQLVNGIIISVLQEDKVKIVKLLKYIVKDFRSNNSVYESLDK